MWARVLRYGVQRLMCKYAGTPSLICPQHSLAEGIDPSTAQTAITPDAYGPAFVLFPLPSPDRARPPRLLEMSTSTIVRSTKCGIHPVRPLGMLGLLGSCHGFAHIPAHYREGVLSRQLLGPFTEGTNDDTKSRVPHQNSTQLHGCSNRGSERCNLDSGSNWYLLQLVVLVRRRWDIGH